MSKSIKALIIVLILLLALSGAAAGGYFYVADYYSDHFYPNTTICNVKGDNATLEEVEGLLDHALSYYSLKVINDETADCFFAEDIDLRYDITDENGQDTVAAMLEAQDAKHWYKHISGTHTIDTFPQTYDEEKLKEMFQSLQVVSPKEKISPEDACLKYNEDDISFEIVPEVEGNELKEDMLYDAVKEAISNMDRELTLDESYFVHPQVRSTDKSLTEPQEKLNKIYDTTITFKDGDRETVLDKKIFKDWMTFDLTTGEVTIDQQKITDYVNTTLDDTFDTVGIERTASSPATGEFTVSGGTYGKIVSTLYEVPEILEELQSGESTEREPIYRQDDVSEDNGGIGNSFVEVDISDQKVYVIKKGKVDYETDCVTGKDTKEYRTPTGIYTVCLKETEYTMVKYDAFVHFWMNFYPEVGVGFHDATWRSKFGGTIYKKRGSHGCVNLPRKAAETIYNKVKIGTVVVVHD